MHKALSALPGGILFGAGLVISDMVNPARVLAFLDVAGRWDPTLAVVMAAALAVAAPAFLLARRLSRPVLGDRFFLPTTSKVEPRLLAGASMFGIGWGLAGMCPGPAVLGLPLAGWPAWIFVAALVVGLIIGRVPIGSRRSTRASAL